MTHGTPEAEFAIEHSLARDLLADQHPDLAHLPITEAPSGWDNQMFRLGDALALRFPRRALASHLSAREQRWLPTISPRLPVPVPTPVCVGKPGRGYPWPWSVVPWIPGAPAGAAGLAAPDAARVGSFLRALHTPAPDEAPINPYRGVALATRVAGLDTRIHRLIERADALTPAHHALWSRALSAPIDLPRTWLHGDLHPANVLVHAGRLAGVIDWGDLCAGDAATDLASVWMLFDDATARAAALDGYPNFTSATLDRARGWAFAFGVILLDSGRADNPAFVDMGRAILRRVLEA
jgi:aminoglycoside phosphotransferase (APT) family kinase protein